MQVRKFLIVRGDGECRIVTKSPRLSLNEVAFRLVVDIPDAWGEINGDINIEMPEPPEAPQIEVVS